MKIKIINTDSEYSQTLKRMEKIFDSEPTSKEGEEAELLALLIEDYEDRVYAVDPPDPITAIKIRMEELELKQKDLIGIIGSKGIVSEILNRKRKLTVNMIRNLSERLRIAANVLIQEYEIER